MNTDDASTGGTRPSCYFIFEIGSHTIFFHVLEILDDAHLVFRPIPLVHLFYFLAGKCRASKTIPHIFAFTAILDVAPKTSDGFLSEIHPTPRAGVLLPEIRDAHTAIDAAGRKEHAFHRHLPSPMN